LTQLIIAMFKRHFVLCIVLSLCSLPLARAQAIHLALLAGDQVNVGVGFNQPRPKIVQLSNTVMPPPNGAGLFAEWDNCGWNSPQGVTLTGPADYYLIAGDHPAPCAPNAPYMADDPGTPISVTGGWQYNAFDGGGGSSVITIAIQTVGDSTKSGMLWSAPPSIISYASYRPGQKGKHQMKNDFRHPSLTQPDVKSMSNRTLHHHAVNRPNSIKQQTAKTAGDHKTKASEKKEKKH
jgi:hypothetical protein